MSTTDAPSDGLGPRRLSMPEFIALMGMMFATIAFSIDAMLPALPEIAEELTPDRPTLAQLILTSFVLGMGVGTFFAGPLSDTFGRKPVILGGAILYLTGAILAYSAPTLELVLAARLLQGLGAAGPRVVAMAIMRDLYSGRQMARVVSFAMLVFTLFPAVAPMIGAAIIAGFGWRSIFLAFLLFSVISVGWLTIRQPETLPKASRRPLQLSTLAAAIKEALSLRQMQFSIVVQTLIFGALFGTLSSIQQVFDLTYDRGAHFHFWFAAIALLAAPAAPLNGRLVMRLGMRPLIRRALWAQGVLSVIVAAFLALGLFGAQEFWLYFLWTVSIFALAGFTIGNLNALAMEPLGHIAGMAASLMGALATIGGAILGAVIGQLYDGTALPLAIVMGVLSLAGAIIMRYMPREAL
ncbi:MFS transporter [Roseobacter sp. HKCCD9010]|uniref:multidrug effflux MFS transporter n=1 Tax=unclassified Roseobacter TaxID=196798 RepID=UPI001492FD03|nr:MULTISPECIES: multidrug effflux MFS transporter [unclassified Roseobacter]MBF9050357.1 MFS transporter [Rhodobacterales bacterium HKCCD4356]NNV14282.1 MFS transporter [Roseobacter sp. HKCCD7357]NNV18475.1 MFS transporter [Roseobacter sp. HKCCD8768]NNV27926.1 MFS transporter [Roseobacter sp. HKCCD8192]NNV32207.1 MFS transporter [Roseobacter sp. HKCCD9061]